MNDILDLYGVKNNSGALEISVEPGQMAAGLMKLGQSCLRLADLYYTLRFVAPGRFGEELEEILTDLNLEYTLNEQIMGRLGNIVKVDFRVVGRRRLCSHLTLDVEARLRRSI